MTLAYLDTHLLYVHLRDPIEPPRPVAEWKRRSLDELADASRLVSALVYDELAYRLLLSWLRDDGNADPLSTFRASPGEVTRSMRERLDRTWAALDALALEMVTTTPAIVDRAKHLMSDPGLGPRDAFHAAHALAAGCELIVSLDSDYDRVNGLRRIGL